MLPCFKMSGFRVKYTMALGAIFLGHTYWWLTWNAEMPPLALVHVNQNLPGLQPIPWSHNGIYMDFAHISGPKSLKISPNLKGSNSLLAWLFHLLRIGQNEPPHFGLWKVLSNEYTFARASQGLPEHGVVIWSLIWQAKHIPFWFKVLFQSIRFQ